MNPIQNLIFLLTKNHLVVILLVRWEMHDIKLIFGLQKK